MSDYTPTTEEVRHAHVGKQAVCVNHGDWITEEQWAEFGAEFDRWLAEHDRQKQAEAWEHARRELRAIPHWWNTEDQYGEFDLQPLGPDKTSEQGAFMHVKQIMDNNPYRQGETA